MPVRVAAPLPGSNRILLTEPSRAFVETYGLNRASTQATALEDSLLAEAVMALLTRQSSWQGTATELLTNLRQTVPALIADPSTFPRYPNKLTSALRRVQPFLRGRGVTIRYERKSGTGQRNIRLEAGNVPSQLS
jgi:hypothetical protein